MKKKMKKKKQHRNCFMPATQQLENSKLVWHKAFLRSLRLSCFVVPLPLDNMIIDSFVLCKIKRMDDS